MSVIMGVSFLLLILAIAARMLWLNGHYHGLTEGMVIGYDEGDRDGFSRGYSERALDQVLAQPSLERHYAGIVGQLPDAEDSAAFWDAVHNGGLHDAVVDQDGAS